MKRSGIAIWLCATACFGKMLLTPQGNLAVYNGLIGVRPPAGGGEPTYLALQWTNAANITMKTNAAYTIVGKPHAMSCWLKADYQAGAGYEEILFGAPTKSYYQFILDTASGSFLFFEYNNGWSTFLNSTATSWSVSTWHHLLGGWTGTNLFLFVDGIQEDSDAWGGLADFEDTSFRIGAYGNMEGVQRFTNGILCDIQWCYLTNNWAGFSNEVYAVATGTRGSGKIETPFLRIKGVTGYSNGDTIPDQTVITNSGSAGSALDGVMNGTGCKAVTW